MNEVNLRTRLHYELLKLEEAVQAREYATFIRKYKQHYGCPIKKAREKARTDFIITGDEHVKGIRTLYYEYIKVFPKGAVRLICETLTKLKPLYKFNPSDSGFKARLLKVEKEGIENYLLKNNAGRPREHNHQQLSDSIEAYKRRPENLTFRQITEFVIADLKQIGIEADKKILSTLKSLYYKHDIKNKIIPAIKGWDAILPPTRTYISHPLDFNELDATSYDQYFVNHTGRKRKLDKLVICLIRDSYSGKILGISTGKVENTALIVLAMRRAVMCAGYRLAKYYVRDNALRGGSKKKNSRKQQKDSDELNEFKNRLVKFGSTFKHSIPNRPTDKARIESNFGHIQQHFLNKIPGFMRAGITAKNRLGKEDIKAYLKNPWDPKTIETGMVLSLMGEYNNAISDRDQLSPNMRFEHPAPNAVQLRPEEFAFLFWNAKTKDIKVRKSEVEVTYKKQRSYFMVDLDSVAWYKINYKKFRVRFDVDENGNLVKDKIYLFTLTDDEFVCSATYNMKKNHDVGLRNKSELEAQLAKNKLTKQVRATERLRMALQEKRIQTDFGSIGALMPNLLGLSKIDEKNADLMLYREELGISTEDIARAQSKEAKVIPIEQGDLTKAELPKPSSQKRIKRVPDRWDLIPLEKNGRQLDEGEVKKEIMLVESPGINRNDDDNENWR